MHRVSTVENQPYIPEIKAVLFEVRLPFRLISLKH
jgi:hypothetical protein